MCDCDNDACVVCLNRCERHGTPLCPICDRDEPFVPVWLRRAQAGNGLGKDLTGGI